MARRRRSLFRDHFTPSAQPAFASCGRPERARRPRSDCIVTAQAPGGLAFDAAGGLLVAENGQPIQKLTGHGGAIFNISIQPQFIARQCETATMPIAVYAGLTIQDSLGCQYRTDDTTFLNSDPSLTVWIR